MGNKFFIFSVLIFLMASAALAQTNPLPTKSDEPLEITADGSLEWNRKDKLFIARDNALAKQGPSSIKSETLTAYYRDGKEGGMDIYQVEAEKDVVLVSRDSTAYGQKADYNLDKNLAVMTGDNLRMESPAQTVTAKDRFEYWVQQGKLVAIGSAKVVRINEKNEKDILEADTISAVMKDNAQGKRVLHTLEAKDHVVITTPTEIVKGAYGIYHADTNKADLTGGVTITKGLNVLEGERAEVDLNTNTSQIFGSKKAGGQVRGIFYPGSEKKLEETPSVP